MSDPTNAHQSPPEPTNACAEPIGQTLHRYGVPVGVIQNVNNWVAELFRLRDRELPRTITLTYMPREDDGRSEHGRGCWTVVENGRIQPALDPRECLAQVAAMLLGAPHPTLWDPVERESHERRRNRELGQVLDSMRERLAERSKELYALREHWDALPFDLARRVADSLGLAIPDAGERLAAVLRFAADAALSPPQTIPVPSATTRVDSMRFSLDAVGVARLCSVFQKAMAGPFPFSGSFYSWGMGSDHFSATPDVTYTPPAAAPGVASATFAVRLAPGSLAHLEQILEEAPGGPFSLTGEVVEMEIRHQHQPCPYGVSDPRRDLTSERPKPRFTFQFQPMRASELEAAREQIRAAASEQPNVLLVPAEVAIKIAPHLADDIARIVSEPTDGEAVDLAELAELLNEAGYSRNEVELEWWPFEWRGAAYDWAIRWQHWEATSTSPGWAERPEVERQQWAAGEPVAPWFLVGAPKPGSVVDAEFTPEPGTEPLRPGDAGFVQAIEDFPENLARAQELTQELYGSPAVDLAAAPPGVISGLPIADVDKGGDDIAASQV